MGWVGELGQQNISARRELAGELRDEGDEGVGQRAREKKKLMKKEERREAREREGKGNDYLMRKGERNIINFF